MTELLKKLNHKEGMKIFVANFPEEFISVVENWVEKEVAIVETPQEANFFLLFVQTENEISANLEAVKNFVQKDEMLWMAYPKGSSKKYKALINRDSGWNTLGANGFEPVRQVAIDENWSALRFRKVEFIKVMTRKNRLS
ncbi:hypothetical protein MMU07_16855 [Aquiflexum sp. LQ15W]|uniref:hypothetical protein n=1 Tax=Cognataquiflexum nitidum TaxID=2922272 RepID=UPI001F13844D|nr:hypothetical protein [Cognataquiflexum nitidum]MCH6201255.1 hypothetical protein [Cognataquiflexum nitidum]